jgi:lipoprotein-releasing system permease protein
VESVALVGMEPQRYQQIIPVGDDIVAGELRVGSGNAVIGQLLADDLGVRVGDKIRLAAGPGTEAQLNITGIFELGVRELDERYVYLDLKQTQSLLDLPGGVTVIDVTVSRIFDAEAIAGRLAQLTGLKAESWMQSNAQLMNALRSQSMSTGMISFFVALSVAFGIASVLSISVVQRTREIGILRAMGTRQRQMLKVFLVQGAVLGFGGSAIGAAAGYGLVWIFNTFGPNLFEVPVSPTLVPAAMLIATVTGTIAAAVPARRAARLDPVQAIRHA